MLEKAGLKSYCDFKEQFTVQGERTTARPDVVVSLPNERVIVIDAKANYDGYMNAANADDPEEQEQHLKQFDRNFSDQIKSLSKKSYENLVKGSIDYVVMFVPGDQVLDTALRRQPDLIDRAARYACGTCKPGFLDLSSECGCTWLAREAACRKYA